MNSTSIRSNLPSVDNKHLHFADPDNFHKEFCFFMKTVQSIVFRTVVDAMKEIVADANIIFSPDGIIVKAVDQSQNAMIHLRLEANQFEEYMCEGTHICGVALLHFHRLLKTMSSTDVLMIYMRRNATGNLDIRVDNNKKAKSSHYQLFLLELPQQNIKPITPDYKHAISIESSEFHKIVREMKDISNNLDIQCHRNTIRFKSVHGHFAEATICLGIMREQNIQQEEIVQGIFNLRYLAMFTKCTTLSNHTILFLKNDFPLIVQYDVSNIGTIQLVLMMEDDE